MKKIIPKIIAERPFISGIVFIAVFASGIFAYSIYTRAPSFDTVKAERKDIRQKINVTGKVKAAREINLAFEKTGKVASVKATVGQKVFAGQTLASLNNQDARARVAEAEATVRLHEAKLEETKKGTRPEEIIIQETKVRAAERGLKDAQQNLKDTIEDSYTKSDDAVRNSVDQLFLSAQTSEPPYKFLGSNPQLEIDVESGRQTVEILLKNWSKELESIQASSDFGALSNATEKKLQEIKSFVDKAALLANSFSATPPYTQAAIDGWKAEMATARSAINTAVSNLLAAEKNFESVKSDLEIARQELSLQKAGATPEAVLVQEAQLRQAKAGLQAAEAELSKTVITAPLTGTISRRDVEPGEIKLAESAAFSLISESDFEIEANISEVDIVKIAVGQTAAITLDAYGDEIIFDGKVAEIDHAETVVDGVPTYLTKVQFIKKDNRIKSGLTANINILIDERKNVIAVPMRAIFTKDGQKMVRILKGETAEEVKVKTGLRGSDSNTEIIDGVSEGDQVIIQSI